MTGRRRIHSITTACIPFQCTTNTTSCSTTTTGRIVLHVGIANFHISQISRLFFIRLGLIPGTIGLVECFPIAADSFAQFCKSNGTCSVVLWWCAAKIEIIHKK